MTWYEQNLNWNQVCHIGGNPCWFTLNCLVTKALKKTELWSYSRKPWQCLKHTFTHINTLSIWPLRSESAEMKCFPTTDKKCLLETVVISLSPLCISVFFFYSPITNIISVHLLSLQPYRLQHEQTYHLNSHLLHPTFTQYLVFSSFTLYASSHHSPLWRQVYFITLHILWHLMQVKHCFTLTCQQIFN